MRTQNLFFLIFAALLTIINFSCEEDTVINTTQIVFNPHFLCWGESDTTIFIFYDSYSSKTVKLMKCNINMGHITTVLLSEVERVGGNVSNRLRGIFSKLDSTIIFNINGKLYRQDINGGSPVAFFAYGNSYFQLLNISEDYTKFTFYSTYGGNPDIFIMDYNGNNLRNLTNDTNFEFLTGEVSTTAGKVIYYCENGIYSVDLDGSNKTNLSNLPPKYIESHESPLYSLDKSKIFFIRHTKNYDRILAMMNLDGTNKTDVTDTTYWVYNFFITNDNNRLVFYGGNYPDNNKELFIDPHSIRSVNFCNSRPKFISHFSNMVISETYDENYDIHLSACRNYNEAILIASSIYY